MHICLNGLACRNGLIRRPRTPDEVDMLCTCVWAGSATLTPMEHSEL